MSQAIFYLLASNKDISATQQVYHHACQLIYAHYKQKQTIYIHCQNKQQAFSIDEILWTFAPDSFIPHSIKDPNNEFLSPVEIGFDPIGSNKKRQVLINLADQCPPFAVNFDHIIDFVADDDGMKAIARDRYKQYRTMGIELATQKLATST